MRTLVVFSALVLLDVMPHCGPPRVVIQKPGEDCGYHGPSWRGDCVAPARCMSLEHGGTRCTTSCERDADCSVLGPTFSCTGSGRPDETQGGPYGSVCVQPR